MCLPVTVKVLFLWDYKHLLKTNVLDPSKKLKTKQDKKPIPSSNVFLLQVLGLH